MMSLQFRTSRERVASASRRLLSFTMEAGVAQQSRLSIKATTSKGSYVLAATAETLYER